MFEKVVWIIIIKLKLEAPGRASRSLSRYALKSSTSEQVCIGVICYSHVNLEKHDMNTCKTAFYHLRNITKTRNCLSQDNAETLVHGFL